MTTTDILAGHPHPLGATVQSNGVNFSLFSKNARSVELLLFDQHDSARPARTVRLDAAHHRTFYYWHCFVPGLHEGSLYGWRVHGPYEPWRGLRFDGSKVLVDPYARAVMAGRNYDRAAAKQRGVDNCAVSMKSVVVDLRGFDWQGDQHPRHPPGHTVVYEMHVGSFTRHPSSGVAVHRRGTYPGLVDRLAHLRELGVTAVELLPVQQFDAQDAPQGLTNLWGYSPVAFMAPHRAYCAAPGDPLAPVREFREMVKALHRAGIEVILDVVFNHTAEVDELGPTLSFRGIEDQAYYILDPSGAYRNFTGCGNTLNGYHSVVRRLIMDALRFWVVDMHVDGFRFDLASVLARDEAGRPIESPPILWEIESDPVLAGTRIIAEAWDAAGLYQVGSFVGDRWSEWNGQFRDDVRRFVRGDPGLVGHLAERVRGSPDIFRDEARAPGRSVNFVTCHDGFTLWDLACYARKHNADNHQDNRDGTGENFSDNHGVEGPTDDPAVLARRDRHGRNLLAILMFSHGTPMLLMGDEVRRTQRGNNNAFCQDNAVAWMDWGQAANHGGMKRFVRTLVRLRRQVACLATEQWWATEPGDPGRPVVRFHGTRVGQPDLARHSHSLAFDVAWPAHREHLYVAMNAWREPLRFQLPAQAGWRVVVDTAREAPADATPPDEAEVIHGSAVDVAADSVVVLLAT